MKLLIAKAAVLAALTLASTGTVLAQCQKACGFSYLIATFTRSCDEGDTCWVSECWGLVYDCGYTDPHNDVCDYPWFGCIMERGES
jgi:hypothetical protein